MPMQEIEYILHFTDKDGKAFDTAEMGLPAGVRREVRNIFKDLGNGRTERTIAEYGSASDQAQDKSKVGLEQCLAKMVAIFARS